MGLCANKKWHRRDDGESEAGPKTDILLTNINVLPGIIIYQYLNIYQGTYRGLSIVSSVTFFVGLEAFLKPLDSPSSLLCHYGSAEKPCMLVSDSPLSLFGHPVSVQKVLGTHLGLPIILCLTHLSSCPLSYTQKWHLCWLYTWRHINISMK